MQPVLSLDQHTERLWEPYGNTYMWIHSSSLQYTRKHQLFMNLKVWRYQFNSSIHRPK